MSEVQAKRAVGRPPRLERETIVATARRVLEEEGVHALSMRRLAKEVGSTPRALYHHVRDKDELLLLVLAGMAASAPRPELPTAPRDRIYVIALHIHDMLQRLPWVVEVLGLGHVTDKGALWMVEEIVNSAIECGLAPREAIRAYRVIWLYIYGDLAVHAAIDRRASEGGEAEHRRPLPDMLTPDDAATLPRLTALGPQWNEVANVCDVPNGLHAVIDGLLARGAGA
ncbi:TetR/AcrR family transcriptional regulator [Streptomyces zagrosensis]|uniref:AcrR family transcriptional regulator n=1 Tax=Streptomyces zagrosensis TaxID=1042984 RepID=A0A7W9QGC4_9ACTN|nr:TetR/AcrR family transcriptional regulator [Streptomyces zagrosensis]MBB5939606.1 AcrR family transcriptional regulator [Streptomyces zagrosensis]